MNTRQKINIAGTDYQIGFSFRAIKLFEELTGKTITEATSTWDNMIYAYCSLKAINPEFDKTIDQFVDILDEQPDLLIQLQYGTQEPQPEPTAESKKKVSLKTILMLWLLSVSLWVAPLLIPPIFGLTWIFRNLKALYQSIAKDGSKPAA